MHVRSSFGVVGFLVMFIGLMMFFPTAISLAYGEDAFVPLFFCAVSISAVGFTAGKLLFNENIELNLRDGFFIVTTCWIMMSFFGGLPFILSGEIPGPINAWFESVSGFTTTGSTILDDIESLSYGMLFWRSMIQWIGGMGIIVLSIALLPLLGVGGMQLYKAEVPGPTIDKVKPRVRDTAATLWKIYLLMTAGATVMYFLGGMTWFESVCHAFTTLATGGYSTRNASIGGFESSFINVVVVIFMFLSGTNFVLHYRWMKGEYDSYFKSAEFRWYAGLTAVAIVFVTISTLHTTFESVWTALEHSAFQVVSILSSTGYGTYDFGLWAAGVQFMLLLFMLSGAMAGSTSGGIKSVRVLLLIKNSILEIRRILHPKAVIPLMLNKQKVTLGIINEVMAFVFIYITVFILGSIILGATGLDLISALGATATAMGNIGPGLGEVGPAQTFAALHPIAKLTLTVCMIMGRLELFTIMIILSRGFWKV